MLRHYALWLFNVLGLWIVEMGSMSIIANTMGHYMKMRIFIEAEFQKHILCHTLAYELLLAVIWLQMFTLY